MSTSPDNLDVICALLDGNDRIEYQEKLEQLKKESPEFWEFETVPYVFKQSATDTDDTKFDYLRDHFGKLKPWKEILDQLEKLNDDSGEDEVYKLAFLARHGQGYHNQAHAKYGNDAWNDYWSKINGDGELVWGPDPELTHLGVSQAIENHDQWEIELRDESKILPHKWYSSPFTRSIDTLIGTWNGIVDLKQVKPLVLEDLRETIGIHTCDKRSTKSIIASKYQSKGFVLEEGFEEEDIYWKPDVRELIAEQAIRINRSFQNIFTSTSKNDSIISITSHSGSIRAQLLVLGHRSFAVGTGGMIPVFIKAKKKI